MFFTGFSEDEVYQPAEDTILLLKAALSEACSEDLVLEIGCGSGLVSIELAFKVRSITATDINPHATCATRSRADAGAIEIGIVRTDLFLGIKGRFDLILFNAPYLPTEAEERTGRWIDYALDGGESGRETINRFLRDLGEHLSLKGRALLLISSLTGLHEVQETANSLGLTSELVASERCFFEQLHVLKIAARNRA